MTTLPPLMLSLYPVVQTSLKERWLHNRDVLYQQYNMSIVMEDPMFPGTKIQEDLFFLGGGGEERWTKEEFIKDKQ